MTGYDILKWPYPISDNDLVVHLVYQGEPISKHRVRFNRTTGRAYTPDATTVYEETLGWEFRSYLQGVEMDSESTFALRCLFYRSNRQRVDCDNLIKSVSDAANGIVWKDDSQVSEVMGKLFVQSDNPRVEIAIYRVPDTLAYRVCLHCGSEFIRPPSNKTRFCSTDCYRESTHVVCTCKECGRDFKIAKSQANRSNFCSRECSDSYQAKNKKADGGETWKCKDCGGPVTKRHYMRCKSCDFKSRKQPTSNYWELREIVE